MVNQENQESIRTLSYVEKGGFLLGGSAGKIICSILIKG